MIRQYFGPLAVFAVGLALLISLTSVGNYQRPATPRPVQNMAEATHVLDVATRIADQLGLHHRSDIESGVMGCRLIISDTPISFERANSTRFDQADHPCWKGTVAVYAHLQFMSRYVEADHAVVWGDAFVYGDPALISRLVAAQPDGLSSNDR